MQPLTISSFTLSSALGNGLDAQLNGLRQGHSGLSRCQFDRARDLNTYIGEVSGVEEVTLPSHLQSFECRNNRLAALGLEQDGFSDAVSRAALKYGKDRVAVFLGTSTSGIYQTELAYREIDSTNGDLPDWYNYAGTHNTYSVSDFTRSYLGLQGISSAISTACSSSAKVFASAQRAMAAGYCDAAVVGGVDSLCLTTLFGFHALQLVADDVCRPSDVYRQGLSIGEAAGFALLESTENTTTDASLSLLGFGESGDAYHMSAPHPAGLGAKMAMESALSRAGLTPGQIDYINLHGTGTIANDLMESAAVTSMFGSETPCSSTKGYTGHTLGAAGIAEAIFALLSLQHGFLPATLNTNEIDPEIKCNILLENQAADPGHILSNSFGFGGSNCSLVLGRNA